MINYRLLGINVFLFLFFLTFNQLSAVVDPRYQGYYPNQPISGWNTGSGSALPSGGWNTSTGWNHPSVNNAPAVGTPNYSSTPYYRYSRYPSYRHNSAPRTHQYDSIDKLYDDNLKRMRQQHRR